VALVLAIGTLALWGSIRLMQRNRGLITDEL
jgi:hypothetical protein